MDTLSIEVTQILSRIITGQLLTDRQVRGITKNVVGKYFSDWFAKPKDAVEAEKRIESAKHHIAEAHRIIGSLTDDLDAQAAQLEKLSREVDEKRNIAERYGAMAAASQETAAAFRAEVEEALRNELSARANEGKRLRQIVSFTAWLLTLILGAALGAYFAQILNWFRHLGA